ncbi:uncharacterized protein LOC110879149 [Helianthus annuus]|uniref:uncharacterized protein LOC110879149 n=1 Tax=Helianthus annuus TaxID=4232 RepID=UPI001652E5E8|nr:uncharacterized protein LOC110879149 [Helianthus annuus]
MESIRDSLAEELVKECEKLRSEVSQLPGMKAEMEALRLRHAAALELMGERDEEIEGCSIELLSDRTTIRSNDYSTRLISQALPSIQDCVYLLKMLCLLCLLEIKLGSLETSFNKI